MIEERFRLAADRIREIPGEPLGRENLEAYFSFCAQFLLMLEETYFFLKKGGLETASLEELQRRNKALYADILPEHYEESYGNPAYAVGELGEDTGRELCFLYAELRSLIGCVYEDRLEDVVIRMELFLEVYGAFVYAASEGVEMPSGEDIRQMIYWFASDYADLAAEQRVRETLCPEECFAVKKIMESPLDDVRYLYGYGEYISENELETAGFLAKLPQETIAAMADTFTEGYRRGFEVTGVDLSKKSTVAVYYRLGFERMIRRAVENFASLGLGTVIFRTAWSVLDSEGAGRRSGYSGGLPNRQYCYDHKDDRAIFLDRNYVNRRLEAFRAAYEKVKTQAGAYGGPAVVEVFGEEDFMPITKWEALQLSQDQSRLWVEYQSRAGRLLREYIPREETSYTIIAFPVPQVGEVFPELFWETVRINTLDSGLYSQVQQAMIDVLDRADYCEIKGRGENRTDLRVNLHKLSDPARETIFENCVADVNIPAGEVFTSPVLKGTQGLLHVSRVFLNGFEYRNLAIRFVDGMVAEYSCTNFEKEQENRRFIYENILFRHETLPMGEFAIGTNTTAYRAAKRLGVEAKLPILIAEKMGPHFALGDTCYAHGEEVRVYNPDGKEIVAKSNEIADRREEKPLEAYFNCHTDITIPYEELGELAAVKKDGTRMILIRDGRFVLPGCEPLNEALDQK